MRSDRYTVGSVTGYAIGEGLSLGGGQDGGEQTIWYIHDSAYGYQIVKSFRGQPDQESKARALAARLNAHDKNPEPPLPGKTHCKHGHLFDILNTFFDKKGSKVCRTCRLDGLHAYRERERAKNKASAA